MQSRAKMIVAGLRLNKNPDKLFDFAKMPRCVIAVVRVSTSRVMVFKYLDPPNEPHLKRELKIGAVLNINSNQDLYADFYYSDGSQRRINGFGSNTKLTVPTPPGWPVDPELIGERSQFTLTSQATAGINYIRIKYQWEESGGTDLDTRTSIADPAIEGEVGWSRESQIEDYLIWSGDNTSPTGSESALLIVDSVIRDYSEATSIRCQLNAFWYGSKASGDITVQIDAYRGSSYGLDGDEFVIDDGVLMQSITQVVNVATQDSSDIDGDLLGYLEYSIESNEISFS